jgi:hypothetical protein
MGRELNQGEASHGLSRFLSFGKEGVLAGRQFGDPIPTFRCLSVLPNAVVGRNTLLAGVRISTGTVNSSQLLPRATCPKTPLLGRPQALDPPYHFAPDSRCPESHVSRQPQHGPVGGTMDGELCGGSQLLEIRRGALLTLTIAIC